MQHHLIRTVRADRPEEIAQQDPDNRHPFGHIPAEDRRGDVFGSMGGGRLPPVDGAGPVDNHHVDNRHQHANQQQNALQHVGPDHGLDTADGRVNSSSQPYRPNPPIDVRTGQERDVVALDSVQCHGGGKHDHAHPAQAQHHEQRGPHQTGPVVESTLEIFVSARDLQPHEKRDPQVEDHQHAEGDCQIPDEHPDSVLDHLTGGPQVGQSREQRRENTQANRKPRHPPATDKEIVRSFLFTAEPDGDAECRQHIQNDDSVIEKFEAACGRQRGFRQNGVSSYLCRARL